MSANPKTVYYGRAFTDVQCHPERLGQPIRWKRPRRVFVNSMSDLFHESVPDDFIDRVFTVTAIAIGRASCRERVCPYVEIWVVDVSLKKKYRRKDMMRVNY